MLLPSDVARLVLGYLQEEGLSATSQAFIHESSNLKEYVEHTTGDGTIPACVFSIFGKNLTTILNEYVASKAKESGHEVPLVMTSLWKKLDFTLNQIKSLQNSPGISASQRTRSRIGVANMARQRVLTVASADSVVCSSVSETSSIISPALTSHTLLSHSTPLSYTDPHTRAATGVTAHQLIHDGGRLLNTPRDSPIQVIVSEHRINSGPISPGRRKWDTPRKRSGLSGPSIPSRSATTVGSVGAEAEPEEAIDENFPQLVIQNARDKILGDRLLQEKLAENINKILANEPAPQTSKTSSSTVEAEQSIDEILGLQGEIHMSDDAIHDILEQTESDPAFQALFDLFDYNRTRLPDGEATDGDLNCSPEENQTAGLSCVLRPPTSNDPAPTQDPSASDPPAVTLKMRAAQDRKTRKSTPPTLLKKTVLDSVSRASRIENSSARLLVSHGEPRSASAAAADSRRKDKPSLLNISESVTQMDIDEPLHTPPPPLDSLLTQEPTSTSNTATSSISAPVSLAKGPVLITEEASASNVNKTHEQAQGSNKQHAPTSSPSFTEHAVVLSPVDVQVATDCTPHPSLLASDGNTLLLPSVSTTSAPAAVPATAASPASASTPVASSPTSASVSETLRAAAASSTAASPASSCAPVAVTHSPSTTNPSAPRKAADSSNIVALKIIVSDSQDEHSSSDAALNRAVSSISGDKIPTIYLSSPAKSPVCPTIPKANFDEVAQAVSGLQSSEAFGSPLACKAQTQQRYIIQVPVDTANPGLQGPAASYYLVTPTKEVQPRQVLLPACVSNGQPLANNQQGGATPTYSQSFSPGSALILPSPLKPVVLPVSVLGQNMLGNIQVVPNQFVDTTASGQQRETLQPKTSTAATKQTSTSGTEKNVTAAAAVEANDTDQQDAATLTHKRILCFDSSSPEIQSLTSKTTETTALIASDSTISQPVHQPERNKRVKPNILCGNKPKRRIEPVRCSADLQVGVSLMKESVSLETQQKDPVKKTSHKQVYSIYNKEPQNENSNSVSPAEAEKKSQTVEVLKSVDGSPDTCSGEAETQDACSFRLAASDSALKSGVRKEKEENSRKEAAEKTPLKSREGRAEKRTPSQEGPNVTANKENEMNVSIQEQQQQSTTPSSSVSRDFNPPAVTQLSPHPQPKTTKAQSKASALAKQAVEMLQDMQGHGSPSTPVRKLGAGSSERSCPGTAQALEARVDCTTPSRQKKGKDVEGTLKHLIPPNTPDVPSCSPASETGSENSINMAAHTLMILSRAAIARTGTPLKDSMRQEGVGEKSPTSSKNKRRRQTSPEDGPPARKESKRSPSRKKDHERKKHVDCFPLDLDVDKFLSSLHYDE